VLRVYLFGGLRVQVEDHLIPPERWARSRLARKLFCRLALAPRQRLHRDELVDALWGERVPADPDNRLSQEVGNIQRILTGAPRTEPRYVQREGQLIVLSPDEPIETDVETFTRLASEALSTRDRAALETAAAHYGSADHGNVLLPEYRDEPWVMRRQLDLRDTYGTLLLQIARLRAIDNELQDAEQALKRLLAEFPAHEEAHRGLMCLYARSGQHDRAVLQFARLREEIRREFGTDVSPKSAELYRRIAANGFPRAAPASGRGAVAAASTDGHSSSGVAAAVRAGSGALPPPALPKRVSSGSGWRRLTMRPAVSMLGLLVVTSLLAAAFGYALAGAQRPTATSVSSGAGVAPPSVSPSAAPAIVTVGPEREEDDILLRDDLSDAPTQWELLPRILRDPELGLAGFDGKEFYIVKPAAYRLRAIANHPGMFTDFFVEFDARLIASDPDGYIALDFRRQLPPREDDYYSFQVFPGDQTYSLMLYRRAPDGDEFTSSAKPGVDRVSLLTRTSQAINRAEGGRNHLGVMADGTAIALWINGQMVANVTDRTYRGGHFVLGVGGRPSSRVEARFANFVVRAVN